MSSTKPWTLTSYLLLLKGYGYKFIRATQTDFLRQAAQGQLSKTTISHWLANDRLYMQGYIKLAGELLRILSLPAKPTPSESSGTVEIRLLDWLVEALVNIRREERFFISSAEWYGLDLDISDESGAVVEEKKLEGLKRFEALFASLTSGQKPADFLPWLEGAVLFWGTEQVYLSAWLFAKHQASRFEGEMVGDGDGGAMRNEFIPNWTSDEFQKFVKTLEEIVDEGVEEAIGGDEERKREVCERAEKVWKKLLDAEEAFWPEVEKN